jgi:beta-lactamase regulating signal transducer with metallopeptidase domain
MMTHLEPFVAGWCRLGWLALLVVTASVLVVAALRKPCRRAFGPERAFLLWLLPPVAMLASLLPHTATSESPLPPIVVALAGLPDALASSAVAPVAGDWRTWAAVFWFVGVVVALTVAAHAQRRYGAKLRGAERYGNVPSRWRILRAADPWTGPALVGAWRPRIVVPADFADRYDDTERALILAHEAMHARRRDGCWCLLAQSVTAIFWFHPLAWWALSALRHDQELACDAGVLRENRGVRRSYANAMLKALSATLPLPVGCAWSPRHPLTERIAMLKQTPPSRARRTGGMVLAVAAVLLGAGGAYAATAPATTNGAHADRYKLKVTLAIDGKAPRLRANTCLEPGAHYAVTEGNIGELPPWHGRFSVAPASHGMLEVNTKMHGGPLEHPVEPRIIARPGQMATILLGSHLTESPALAPGKHTIKIELTPSVGC